MYAYQCMCTYYSEYGRMSVHNYHHIYICIYCSDSRALDKREYLVIIRDNFCLYCIKTYVETPHLDRFDEMVHMRGSQDMV